MRRHLCWDIQCCWNRENCSKGSLKPASSRRSQVRLAGIPQISAINFHRSLLLIISCMKKQIVTHAYFTELLVYGLFMYVLLGAIFKCWAVLSIGLILVGTEWNTYHESILEWIRPLEISQAKYTYTVLLPTKWNGIYFQLFSKAISPFDRCLFYLTFSSLRFYE